MNSIIQIFENLLSNNSVDQWLFAGIALAVVFVLLMIIRKILISRFTRLAKKTSNTLDDTLVEALSKTKTLFLLIFSLWISTNFLTLPDRLVSITNGVLVVAVLVQIGIWVNSLLAHIIRHFVRLEIEDEASQVATTTALTFVGRLILWSLVLLLGLDNLGVDITALVTGLGIGGIAVALAAQNILGDLFASLSIMFDKPFVVGDFVIVGDMLGTVERTGLKTTRIRSLHGEQLVLSNNDLLSSRIKNYKRMEERRVLFTIGVTYQTPHEKLAQIPEMIKTIIEEEERVRFDRAHFKSYGDSSLVFEIVYWVLNPDYNVYMDIQQKINLDLFERFEQESIEFAYPTRTLHIVQGEEPVDSEDAKKEGVS